MQRVVEVEVVDRSEVVVPDPGLSAVRRVEEGVAGGPAVQRVDEVDGVHLARHVNDRPRASGVRRVRELADVAEQAAPRRSTLRSARSP